MILHLDDDAHLFFVSVRTNNNFANIQLCGLRLQFDASRNTIPVALGLVSNTVRILSNTNILNAVVHTDGDGVATSKIHIACNIITMRNGK